MGLGPEVMAGRNEFYLGNEGYDSGGIEKKIRGEEEIR